MIKCEKCDKEFETERQLQGHMMGAHKHTDRKERIPVGVKRPKMKANLPPNKVGRWVNDDPGRLQRFLDGGYEYVTSPDATDKSTDMGSKLSMIVDKGTGKRAYLMAIDKALYDEDQAAKQGKLDRVDDAIKHGKFENKLGDAGYDAGIKYDPK